MFPILFCLKMFLSSYLFISCKCWVLTAATNSNKIAYLPSHLMLPHQPFPYCSMLSFHIAQWFEVRNLKWWNARWKVMERM